MDDNLKIILAEFEKLKGQFVIINWNIQRFIAIASDKHDYYYVTYDGRKLHWNSCLTNITQLRGKIDNEHYEDLIRLAKLNHYDQQTLWGNSPDDIVDSIKNPNVTYKMAAQKHKREMENIHKDSEFLTEVCWDLN